ncbi:MAG: hypothetical protein OJF51_003044 [Nitrospira sp.]|nr:MAG: hypothetical protein OJF51_003044 [Nitrospira sp.]
MVKRNVMDTDSIRSTMIMYLRDRLQEAILRLRYNPAYRAEPKQWIEVVSGGSVSAIK